MELTFWFRSLQGSFALRRSARPANLITDLAIAQVRRPLREAF